MWNENARHHKNKQDKLVNEYETHIAMRGVFCFDSFRAVASDRQKTK
jgi:hypothetical protein